MPGLSLSVEQNVVALIRDHTKRADRVGRFNPSVASRKNAVHALLRVGKRFKRRCFVVVQNDRQRTADRIVYDTARQNISDRSVTANRDRHVPVDARVGMIGGITVKADRNRGHMTARYIQRAISRNALRCGGGITAADKNRADRAALYRRIG